MAEPDISPLARSLAEQNNVNWRQLAGSGPDGRITERDVFEYLARVAEGDAPLDPTPEPLPAGLEVWPEEDARSARPAAATAPPPQDFDEDLLLADEDLLEYESHSESHNDSHSERTPSAPSFQHVEADDELALDFDEAPRQGYGTESPAARADEDIFLFDEAAPEPEQRAPARPATDFGDLDFGDAPGTIGEDDLEALDFTPRGDARSPGDEEAAQRYDTSGPALGVERQDLGLSYPADEDRGAGARADPWTNHDRADNRAGGVSQSMTDDVADDGPMGRMIAPSADLPPVQEADDDVRVHEDWTGNRTGAEADGETELAVSETREDAGGEQQEVLGKLPLMSHGLLLRSQVDLTPLAEAQAAVGRSLGGGEVAPTAFVVRAAAKAMESQALGEDARVALAVISEDGLGVAAIDKAADMSFTKLLKAVTDLGSGGRTERDRAGLMVADMSNFAVDEAVFSVGMPVLTLGRLLVDSSDGYTYGTLSLSGDLNPAQAARYLGRVVELLSSPIELVI